MIRKKTDQLSWGIFLLILIFNIQFTPICAQNEMPDSLITKRFQFIKNTLEHDKVNTQRWWYGWLGAYSAATIGQGAVYFISNGKSMRQDMALGAATTLLGVAGQFISPFIPGNEPEQLILIPATTRRERLKKLAIAEELLNECAKRENLAMNWKNHALTGAVNLGGGLITWLGFKRTVWDGIGYFALNSIITETQIWTQPTLAKRNYRKYRQKFPENEQGISYQPEINWYLEAYPGGIGIKAVF
ncbi:MAG: hypothetical protein WC220_15620 [Pedobacter sp.]|jgi:hypothetical protein